MNEAWLPEILLPRLAFWVFAAGTLFPALLVVLARNPVHAVLFLILAFFSSAGLFLLAGAEFLAMVMVIVYVGAIAVLFLFVVMMLDLSATPLRERLVAYFPVASLVGVVLAVELAIAVTATTTPAAGTPLAADASNTHALGYLIYTKYAFLFQLSGLLLLVAMIGAIVLTLRTRPGVRRQSVDAQTGRKREEAVRLVQVRTGAGVPLDGIPPRQTPEPQETRDAGTR